jgi:hypothetical protein
MSNRSWFLASEGKQQGPYPTMMAWYYRWYVLQFALAERA